LNKTGKTVVKSSTKLIEVNVKGNFTSHIDKKAFLTFVLTPYERGHSFRDSGQPDKITFCNVKSWGSLSVTDLISSSFWSLTGKEARTVCT
jgi:hypothetical protein